MIHAGTLKTRISGLTLKWQNKDGGQADGETLTKSEQRCLHSHKLDCHHSLTRTGLLKNTASPTEPDRVLDRKNEGFQGVNNSTESS